MPCEWDKTSVTPNRLKALLDRGSALGFALEKWKRSGLWVLTENDEEYPKRVSHRLSTKAPPILFGYGDRRHLNKGGIAVVGSRHADQEDLDLTHVLGRRPHAKDTQLFQEEQEELMRVRCLELWRTVQH